MVTPVWALSLAYWLHMVATVAWIGGLTTLAIFMLPVARRTLDMQAYANLLAGIRRRLDPVGWFSLAVLAGTGMVQMSANPNYQGFLAINNRWATAILVKHILFVGMVGLSAYITWGLMPRLQRLALRQARAAESTRTDGAAETEIAVLQHYELWLLRANLILGILVLASTAIARAT